MRYLHISPHKILKFLEWQQRQCQICYLPSSRKWNFYFTLHFPLTVFLQHLLRLSALNKKCFWSFAQAGLFSTEKSEPYQQEKS